MNLGVTGIVINGFNQILLIQRDDTKTWAPPAGGMEGGELPTDTVIREVGEETGLKVMPVRLVAFAYAYLDGGARIQLVYRCMEAGGEITPSPESPQVGYFPTKKLPEPMLGLSRGQIERAVEHTGGAVWYTESVSLWLKLRIVWLKWVVYPRLARERKARGEPEYVPAPGFKVSVAIAVRDEVNHLMWVQQDGQSYLPTVEPPKSRSPWDAAADLAQAQFGRPVKITRLVAIYFKKEATEALVLWEAQAKEGKGLAEIPADADPQSRRFAEEVLENNDLVNTDWL